MIWLWWIEGKWLVVSGEWLAAHRAKDCERLGCFEPQNIEQQNVEGF